MNAAGSHIHNQIVCANVFIRKGSRVLVLRRSPNRRYAPDVVHPVGGKVDPNENPFSAAQREALEETGLRVTNMKLEAVLLDITPVPSEPHNWLIYHFSADYESGEIQPTTEGQLVWLTPRELSRERLHPSLQGLIDDILDDRKGTMFITHTYDSTGSKIAERSSDVCAIGPSRSFGLLSRLGLRSSAWRIPRLVRQGS